MHHKPFFVGSFVFHISDLIQFFIITLYKKSKNNSPILYVSTIYSSKKFLFHNSFDGTPFSVGGLFFSTSIKNMAHWKNKCTTSMIFRLGRDYISLIRERQQNFVTSLIILTTHLLLQKLSFNVAYGLSVFICTFPLG